jgi:multidrug resistance efflux pump
MVKKGDPLFAISNETQQLNKENAQLAANFADLNANQSKLTDAKIAINQAKNKLKNDSLLWVRQKALWQEQIGTKNELEQRELVYLNTKDSYSSAILKYDELKRQLDFADAQSKKNLRISNQQQNDFTIKSKINGVVYSVNKVKGELASPQTPLAVIGDPSSFILEMQVDEFDILKIKLGQLVMVSLESYHDKTFEATVTKVNPLMNERSKTFLVEAVFKTLPEKLYPNISFEANILLQTKDNALLIPRTYMENDSTVILGSGEKKMVKTGLKDFNKIEIVSGITAADELLKPKQ